MTVTISRWGNSLAVRLPKDALEAVDLQAGDVLEVQSARGTIMLTLQNGSPTLNELIERITPANLHSALFDTRP